jgi:hypothetical protein
MCNKNILRIIRKTIKIQFMAQTRVSLFSAHFQELFTNVIFVFINKQLLSFKTRFCVLSPG